MDVGSTQDYIMKKFIRYTIVVPMFFLFWWAIAIGFLINPIELWKEFFKHLQSGESFGVFD